MVALSLQACGGLGERTDGEARATIVAATEQAAAVATAKARQADVQATTTAVSKLITQTPTVVPPTWEFTLVRLDSNSAEFIVENASSNIAVFCAGEFAWEVEAIVNEVLYPYPAPASFTRVEYRYSSDCPGTAVGGVPLPPGFRIKGIVSLKEVPDAATQRRLILSSNKHPELSLVYDLEKLVEVGSSKMSLPTKRTDLKALGDVWEIPHVWRVVVESLHSSPPSCPGRADPTFQMALTNLGGYNQDVTEIYPLVFIEDEIFSPWTIFTSCRVSGSSTYYEAINPLDPGHTATYSVSYRRGAGDARWPTQIDLSKAKLLLFLEEKGAITSYATYDLSAQ